jgi:hypothetical protein
VVETSAAEVKSVTNEGKVGGKKKGKMENPFEKKTVTTSNDSNTTEKEAKNDDKK